MGSSPSPPYQRCACQKEKRKENACLWNVRGFSSQKTAQSTQFPIASEGSPRSRCKQKDRRLSHRTLAPSHEKAPFTQLLAHFSITAKKRKARHDPTSHFSRQDLPAEFRALLQWPLFLSFRLPFLLGDGELKRSGNPRLLPHSLLTVQIETSLGRTKKGVQEEKEPGQARRRSSCISTRNFLGGEGRQKRNSWRPYVHKNPHTNNLASPVGVRRDESECTVVLFFRDHIFTVGYWLSSSKFLVLNRNYLSEPPPAPTNTWLLSWLFPTQQRSSLSPLNWALSPPITAPPAVCFTQSQAIVPRPCMLWKSPSGF